MSRDWKPGDVAMVECSDGQDRRAGYRRGTIGNPEAWEFEDGAMRRVNESRTRPLAVLDPEDREQVERLCDLLYGGHRGDVGIRVATALRKFANPTPPRPEEPSGLGAVVEDAEGARWVRAGLTRRKADDWRCIEGEHVGYWSEWHNVSAVRVLSEGVPS
jgi:hypothetical protein